MAVTLASRVGLTPGVLAQRAKPDDPTTVVLDPRSGEYYTLDEVGTRVWQLCDGSRNVSEIVATVAREFEAPRDVIEADVLELLQDLADEHLVVCAP